MVFLMKEDSNADIRAARSMIEKRGYRTYSLDTTGGHLFAALNVKDGDAREFETLIGGGFAKKIETPYLLASRTIKDSDTVVDLPFGGSIGGGRLSVIAGPCSIESEEQLRETAIAVKASGATVLRGGAFKPRSSPYSFQGMGTEGLRLLKKIGNEVQLPVITEVMDADDLPVIEEYADIIQIGARNCQNFSLLKKAGRIAKPVLLKRGMMMTVTELLLSAEYILAEGNMNVILCERGIRTFERDTRNTLDISAVPVLKSKTHLPIVVDPSHATGDWRLVQPMALAAVAAGADGLMIECHSRPQEALCDGEQSLRPDKFDTLMKKIRMLDGIADHTVA
jgi:3-deoxy-7-phosphoheptulonate synthase